MILITKTSDQCVCVCVCVCDKLVGRRTVALLSLPLLHFIVGIFWCNVLFVSHGRGTHDEIPFVCCGMVWYNLNTLIVVLLYVTRRMWYNIPYCVYYGTK